MKFFCYDELKELFNRNTYKEVLSEKGLPTTLLFYFLLILLVILFFLPIFLVYLPFKAIYILKTIFIKERKNKHEKNQ